VTFRVEFTPEADADLDLLFDFPLDQAEAAKVLRTVTISHLSTTPYRYRKVGPRPTLP
jgi:hypothetical protein